MKIKQKILSYTGLWRQERKERNLRQEIGILNTRNSDEKKKNIANKTDNAHDPYY